MKVLIAAHSLHDWYTDSDVCLSGCRAAFRPSFTKGNLIDSSGTMTGGGPVNSGAAAHGMSASRSEGHVRLSIVDIHFVDVVSV